MRPVPDFIHEFVPGRSERTLLLLHGTGANERDLLSLGRELDQNASLLSPRGQVLENGMPRFFRRLAEGVFDLEDLKRRTHELADFVAAAAEHYQFSAEQVIAVGYSNGANIAASILLLRPQTLHGAILFRAMVPLMPPAQPELSSVRVWIGAGDQDPIIPTSESQRLAELLRGSGADVGVGQDEGANGGLEIVGRRDELAEGPDGRPKRVEFVDRHPLGLVGPPEVGDRHQLVENLGGDGIVDPWPNLDRRGVEANLPRVGHRQDDVPADELRPVEVVAVRRGEQPGPIAALAIDRIGTLERRDARPIGDARRQADAIAFGDRLEPVVEAADHDRADRVEVLRRLSRLGP